MSTPTAGPSHNPQSATYPSQDNKRRQDAEPEAARRFKHSRPPLPPPHVLATLVPDSPAFVELMKIEQKLDWTLLRKKAEVNDALGRPIRIKRSLRVFISNTAHDQSWQKELAEQEEGAAARSKGSSTSPAKNDAELPKVEGGGADSVMADVSGDKKASDGLNGVDLNSGKGIPGWVLKVEGRLVDSGNNRLDKTKRKFSTFLKSAVIEFDGREAPTFPEGNIVEWHPQPLVPDLDGFEVLRKGDQNVNCRIILHMQHYPERFKVLNPLGDMIAIKEGTRAEVMAGVWKLVKITGAQDKEDSTIIRPVGGLEKLVPPGSDGIPFHSLPSVVNQFLAHPDPIVIPYTIHVDQDFNFHPQCFDIPIELEDPLKSKMSNIITSFEGQEGKEIVQLEDKVGELAYFARDLKQKRDFLESFAANPQTFIENWLAAQARDLDSMLGYQIGNPGINGGNVREEDLRRSDLFSMPWVDEAITIHEAGRMEAERRGTR